MQKNTPSKDYKAYLVYFGPDEQSLFNINTSPIFSGTYTAAMFRETIYGSCEKTVSYAVRNFLVPSMCNYSKSISIVSYSIQELLRRTEIEYLIHTRRRYRFVKDKNISLIDNELFLVEELLKYSPFQHSLIIMYLLNYLLDTLIIPISSSVPKKEKEIFEQYWKEYGSSFKEYLLDPSNFRWANDALYEELRIEKL